MAEEHQAEVVFFFTRLLLCLALCFLVCLIVVFLQDLQKKEAVVGAIGAWPPCAVVAVAPKAPMLDVSETKKKKSSPTPNVVVSKERIHGQP
jgi:hypothetical protein